MVCKPLFCNCCYLLCSLIVSYLHLSPGWPGFWSNGSYHLIIEGVAWPKAVTIANMLFLQSCFNGNSELILFSIELHDDRASQKLNFHQKMFWYGSFSQVYVLNSSFSSLSNLTFGGIWLWKHRCFKGQGTRVYTPKLL